jgi:hypothetical protein
MGTEMVPETSVIFNKVTRRTIWDFNNNNGGGGGGDDDYDDYNNNNNNNNVTT